MSITVRKAQYRDIDAVEASYTELLIHEKEYGAYTVWQMGVYPTRETAEKGLVDGGLYVAVMDNDICGSMIVDRTQPEEYKAVNWNVSTQPNRVLVIHLLCIRPSKSGLGIGSTLVRFAVDLAQALRCVSVRLDTGAQNLPARALYRSLGFTLAGSSPMKIGGVITHSEHLFLEYNVRSDQLKKGVAV